MTKQKVAHRAPLSMDFPRQEYWSRMLLPALGDLSNPGIKSESPALLTAEPPGKPLKAHYSLQLLLLPSHLLFCGFLPLSFPSPKDPCDYMIVLTWII